MSSNVVVRQVYMHNVEAEFKLIRQSLSLFPFASLVTELPGTVFPPEGIPAHIRSTLPRGSFYKVMKKNIDALNLIQMGLTLSDANGNLPSFGTPSKYVWEFNFLDFDCESDLQDPEAVSQLERHGVDLLKNRRFGIDSSHFAELLWDSGLIVSFGQVKWVTFHGPFDFGFLIKILTRSELPEDVGDFLKLVELLFGTSVFVVEDLICLFRLRGGLDQVAGSLGLDRVAGKAGSDSLLTMNVFLGLLSRHREISSSSTMDKFSHMVYGGTPRIITN